MNKVFTKPVNIAKRVNEEQDEGAQKKRDSKSERKKKKNYTHSRKMVGAENRKRHLIRLGFQKCFEKPFFNLNKINVKDTHFEDVAKANSNKDFFISSDHPDLTSMQVSKPYIKSLQLWQKHLVRPDGKVRVFHVVLLGDEK